MKQIPRILSIIKIEPYKITAYWNTGVITETDFRPLISEYEKNNWGMFMYLSDFDKFKNVSIEDGKLIWNSVKIEVEFLGSKSSQPLDCDPLTMYNQSKVISKSEPIGLTIRNLRRKMGITIDQLAQCSGLSKSYVSKIEKGVSDIQYDALLQVVEIGLGKKIVIQ